MPLTLFDAPPPEPLRESQAAIYQRLAELGISFLRVSHDYAATMEDCLEIGQALGFPLCKNLFLCNRQQTEFYLLLLPGDKPFKTKYLSSQLGVSRLSFATEEALERLLHCVPGSASPLELLFDREGRIRLAVDEELRQDPYLCCHPGYADGTIRISAEDFHRYLASTGHGIEYVTLPREENLSDN